MSRHSISSAPSGLCEAAVSVYPVPADVQGCAPVCGLCQGRDVLALQVASRSNFHCNPSGKKTGRPARIRERTGQSVQSCQVISAPTARSLPNHAAGAAVHSHTFISAIADMTAMTRKLCTCAWLVGHTCNLELQRPAHKASARLHGSEDRVRAAHASAANGEVSPGSAGDLPQHQKPWVMTRAAAGYDWPVH